MVQLKKTSFIDFPGRISSVFFFPGCNLRCPWCHNKELVSGGAEGLIGIADALAHVTKRRAVLGGVVLSGGEPCLQNGLPDLIAEIKALNLPVKLDTNGMFPAMLEKLFSRKETRPDYIALDLKIAPARYAELANSSQEKKNEPRSYTEARREEMGNSLIRSAALIRESGIAKGNGVANSVGDANGVGDAIAHEYRTLALPGGYIGLEDIEALAPLADDAPWYFRPFAGGNCLDPAWDSFEELPEEARARLEALAAKARALGKAGKVIGEQDSLAHSLL